jgi:hypothetical protein
MIDASPSEVFRAFNDPTRRQWGSAFGYTVMNAVAPRFLRLMMHDGTLVSVSIGRKGMLVAAKTIALTAIDLFKKPALIEEAKTEWLTKRGADFQYKSLLGDRKPALNYRD